MTQPIVLEAKNISISFAGASALRGVDLQISAGEMVALIGPSGAGKSTLLRSLAGLAVIDPGQGRVEAFGETLQADGRIGPEARRLRARIGVVFQKFNLVGRLSLFSNVMIGRLGRTPFWRGLLGLWRREDQALAMAALDRVGVAPQAGQRASTLSGGQQQRGAIARALVQQADVILADEPVASLDPASAHKVMDILARINREDGATVLVTLHQIDMAQRYCRRIVALSRGRVVYDGPASGLDHDQLAAIYGADYDDAAPLSAAAQEDEGVRT